MAQHRHKRETPAHPRPKSIPRSVQVAAPLAVVATLSAVTMGVLAAEPATSGEDLLASSSSTSQSISGSVPDSTALSRRGATTVSRSQIRTAARAEAAVRKDLTTDRQARRLAKKLDAELWTTEALNLYFASRQVPTPNRMNWKDPKTDELLKAAATAVDADKRKQAIGAVQTQLTEANVWVPLASQPLWVVAGDRLEGVRAHGIYGAGPQEVLCRPYPLLVQGGTRLGVVWLDVEGIAQPGSARAQITTYKRPGNT